MLCFCCSEARLIRFEHHSRLFSRRTINFRAEQVSPNSPPKVSPDGQFGGGNGAMRSGERAVEKVA